jgi:hypothetical protein
VRQCLYDFGWFTIAVATGDAVLAIWQEQGAIVRVMTSPHMPFGSSVTLGGGALPGSGRVEFGQAGTSVISMKWSALHDAASAVAALAGIAAEPMRPEARNFPAQIRDIGGWRKIHAEQGIEDLSAIMETGLAALLAAHARGASPAAAALALWQEFQAARTAVLALTPTAAEPPKRFA